MTLQQILSGTFVPPTATKTRVHRCGFDDMPKYVEPPPRAQRDAGALNIAERLVLKEAVKLGEPVTSPEMAALTNMAQSYCSILLSSLYKKGRMTRTAHKKPGTRFYSYTVVAA